VATRNCQILGRCVAGNFRGFEKPTVRPQLVFFLCGSPSVDFLNSEEMCGCAAHYFTKCVVIQGLKFFLPGLLTQPRLWGRGIETRKSGLHAWENFKHPIHCNHQRSSANVSQSRKERCAGRLTSKAVDWDGRAGPGARAAGGSTAGAELGAPQRVQEVPRV